MANEKIKCENCGFEEELTPAQVEERKAAGTYDKCEKCGAKLAASEPPSKGRRASAKARAAEAESQVDGAMENSSAAAGSPEEDLESQNEAKGRADIAKESARQAAEAARAQFKKAFEAGRKDPVFITSLLDSVMRKLTAAVTPDCFDKNASRAVTLGHYALLLLALASLVMGIFLGIRMGTMRLVFGGIGIGVFLLLAQYVAVKSFSLFDGAIASHPSKVTRPAIVEIVSMLNLIGALAGLAMLIFSLVYFIDFVLLAYGILVLTFGFLAAAVILQADRQLNVSYDAKVSLAEQLLGLFAIHLKATVRLVPYVFGLGLAVCTILCIPPFVISLIQGAASPQSLGVLITLLSLAITFALSPILVYIFVMLGYLIIDLVKAVLGKK